MISQAGWLDAFNRRRRRQKAARKAERAFHTALLDIGPGDICVDCGANRGDVTAFMVRTGAQVHAFEPDPYAFSALQGRFGATPGVTLHAAAVGVSEGTATLHRAPGFAAEPGRLSESSSLLARPRSGADGETLTVPVIDLPGWLDALPVPPRMLKLDIEGAEVEILESLFAGDLIDRMGHVFVETHETQHPALARRTRALLAEVARRGWSHVNLDWA